eukprot:tig00020601_g11727.t1
MPEAPPAAESSTRHLLDRKLSAAAGEGGLDKPESPRSMAPDAGAKDDVRVVESGPFVVVAFVNARSGELDGHSVSEVLQSLPAVRQLYDLRASGPALVFDRTDPSVTASACRAMSIEELSKHARLAVICGGGDGSVQWVMSMLDGVPNATFAPMPLGTSNDLSHVLGWGRACGSERRVRRFVEYIDRAKEMRLDRWAVHCVLGESELPIVPPAPSLALPPAAGDPDPGAPAAPAAPEPPQPAPLDLTPPAGPCTAATPPGPRAMRQMAEASTRRGVQQVFNNYFSIGFDAQVTLDFNAWREEHPHLCRVREINKFWYAWHGAPHLFRAGKLHRRLRIVADGRPVELPRGLACLVAVNIPSYANGMDLWRTPRPHPGEPPGKWAPADPDDGRIEVVGMTGPAHLSLARVRLRRPIRLAQARELRIENLTDAMLPAQIDGEGWAIPPRHTAVISLHSRVRVLRGYHDLTAPSCCFG